MDIQKDINKEVLKSDEEKVEDLAKDAEDLEKAVEEDIKDKAEKVEEVNDAKAEPLDAKDGSGKAVKDVVASDKEFKEEQEREDVEFPEVKKSELEEGLFDKFKNIAKNADFAKRLVAREGQYKAQIILNKLTELTNAGRKEDVQKIVSNYTDFDKNMRYFGELGQASFNDAMLPSADPEEIVNDFIKTFGQKQEVKPFTEKLELNEAKKTLDDVYEDPSLESIWETKWKELVPANGKAKTPIGEVMRCFSKVSHEYFQNGSMLGKGYNNRSNYDAANDMLKALKADGLNDNELYKLWDKIWSTRSEAAYDHYLAEFYEKFINKYLKNGAVSEGLNKVKNYTNGSGKTVKDVAAKLKPFTEKLELNEAAETQTEIKELLSDYLLNELEESEFMDNLAWRAEHDVTGYNHDWCAEEASPDYKEKEYEFINELVEDLMANCPLEESLKEDFNEVGKTYVVNFENIRGESDSRLVNASSKKEAVNKVKTAFGDKYKRLEWVGEYDPDEDEDGPEDI